MNKVAALILENNKQVLEISKKMYKEEMTAEEAAAECVAMAKKLENDIRDVLVREATWVNKI